MMQAFGAIALSAQVKGLTLAYSVSLAMIDGDGLLVAIQRRYFLPSRAGAENHCGGRPTRRVCGLCKEATHGRQRSRSFPKHQVAANRHRILTLVFSW